MHDRYLTVGSSLKLSTAEAYHWFQTVSSFNQQLLHSLRIEQRAAIVLTAGFVGRIVFYNIDARTPQEAWPLKPASASDLNWLTMSDGKKEIWKLSQPLKEDLVYQVLAPSHTNSLLPTLPTETMFEVLPPELISFCNLDTASTSNNSPYYTVASGLAQVLNIEGPEITIILRFLSFISNMQPSFKEPLKAKEPRALLLLAYWFAVICKIDVWWLSRRAILEGQATCLYLEREIGYDINIQTLLRFPKTTFSSLASQIGRQELTEGPVRRFSSLRLLTLRTKPNLHTGLASRLVLIWATSLLESKDIFFKKINKRNK